MDEEVAVAGHADEPKMWLAVRTDVLSREDRKGMTAQKLAGQAGHAYGNLFIDATAAVPALMEEYTCGRRPGSDVDKGQAKITVTAKNEGVLLRVYQEARQAGIPAILVKDEGRTELPPGTPTVCAFGPARRSQLPPFLRKLRKMEDRDAPVPYRGESVAEVPAA